MLSVLLGNDTAHIGTYSYPSDYLGERMNIIYMVSRTKSEFENYYGITISKLSYQVKNIMDVNEAIKVYRSVPSKLGNIENQGKRFVQFYTLDSNFRINGIVVLIGTPLNN